MERECRANWLGPTARFADVRRVPLTCVTLCVRLLAAVRWRQAPTLATVPFILRRAATFTAAACRWLLPAQAGRGRKEYGCPTPARCVSRLARVHVRVYACMAVSVARLRDLSPFARCAG